MSENSVMAIGKILKIEGGFVNNPSDKGGPTNWGITQRVYNAYVGYDSTNDEIRNMPEGDAMEIYKTNYWDAIGGDSILEYAVAYIIFDQAVNRGVSSALKQACRTVGIAESGGVNSFTISSVNAYDPYMFVTEYLMNSEDFYNAIVARDPSQAKFQKGWLNRVNNIRTYAEAKLGKVTALVVETVKENPWIWAFPAIAVLGVIAYYQMNKKGK
jgi:lysozyme family protein